MPGFIRSVRNRITGIWTPEHHSENQKRSTGIDLSDTPSEGAVSRPENPETVSLPGPPCGPVASKAGSPVCQFSGKPPTTTVAESPQPGAPGKRAHSEPTGTQACVIYGQGLALEIWKSDRLTRQHSPAQLEASKTTADRGPPCPLHQARGRPLATTQDTRRVRDRIWATLLESLTHPPDDKSPWGRAWRPRFTSFALRASQTNESGASHGEFMGSHVGKGNSVSKNPSQL
ncbi:hypothetical protein MG293_019264 [Ovis ammon polii]|uniref:Uncharacterized protein n=1 Tax=Ovis ammon polii TaxID=230172 RepID=A0AAD4TRN9_OVIAM|nr:hypothetical protein MG293_019264 [Ovis ammon polii]